MLMNPVKTAAASRTALLLIVFSLIDVEYAQKWQPRGTSYPMMASPGSGVSGQVNPQPPGSYIGETSDRRHNPTPQQFVNNFELSTEIYDERYNNHLENLVIPLAIIQGLRHAVATGKKATPLNLSQPNTTQKATSIPEDSAMNIIKTLITHYNLPGTADLKKMNVKFRHGYGRAIHPWEKEEEANAEDQTDDSKKHSMNSNCEDRGPPCCLNAVDCIACMLSNLKNSTNASELEGNLPDITLTDIDSTMLDKETLEKQLELMVAAKPKIQQFRYSGGQPVVLKIANDTCKSEYVLLSDINSGLMFAVPNTQKHCGKGQDGLSSRGFKREANPSQSLSVRSDVKYEIDQEAKLKYSIGITVDGTHANPNTCRTYRSSPNTFNRAAKDTDEALDDVQANNRNGPNASDKKNDGNGAGGSMPTRIKEGKNEIKLEPIDVTSSPKIEETPFEEYHTAEEAEEYKKYNNWFSHTKTQPNQFCLAFPVMKSHCAEWVNPPESQGYRGKRREAEFKDECIKQCVAVSGLDHYGKSRNSHCALVLCYLNGSYSENRAYGTPRINPYQYCGEYDKDTQIPAPKEAPVVIEPYPSSCHSQTTPYRGSEGYAKFHNGPSVQQQQDTLICKPRYLQSASKCLQESNYNFDGRLPNHQGNAPASCPQLYTPNSLSCILDRRLLEYHRNTPSSCPQRYTPKSPSSILDGTLPKYHRNAPSSCPQWYTPHSPMNPPPPPCMRLPEWRHHQSNIPCLQNCAAYSLPIEPLRPKVANTQGGVSGIYCRQSCDTAQPWQSTKADIHSFKVAVSQNCPVQPQYSQQPYGMLSENNQPQYVCADPANAGPRPVYLPSNFKKKKK